MMRLTVSGKLSGLIEFPGHKSGEGHPGYMTLENTEWKRGEVVKTTIIILVPAHRMVWARSNENSKFPVVVELVELSVATEDDRAVYRGALFVGVMENIYRV